MRRGLLVLGLVLGLGLGTGARAEPLSISVEDAIGVFGALQMLDGRDEILKGVEPPRVVKVPYQLSGETRLAIAKNMIALKVVVEAFRIAREGKLKEGGEARKGKVSEKLIADISGMLKRKEKVDLVKLKAKDLLGGGNPIPPSVLARLAPILEGGEK